MTTSRMSLRAILRKARQTHDFDFLLKSVELVAGDLMEEEVSEETGAGKHVRAPGRITRRNGYRERPWDTRAGTVLLKVPKLRSGHYFPSLLEPRRRAEEALLAVVQEAYVLGISTRKVETLARSLGLDGIGKSEVSRICARLDGEIGRWRNRPLIGRYPYLWLDATYLKVHQGDRVVSEAVILAYAVHESGEREIVGLEAGRSEDAVFWTDFLKSLVQRGLAGVQLVISDAHLGLREAIDHVLAGAAWQRCRVHFLRNALARVSRTAHREVADRLRLIFLQPDKAAARAQLRQTADGLRPRYPAVAEMLDDAEEDLLAHMSFPQAHWRSICSTNPLESINKEIKRRTRVAGIFPNRQAIFRLVGALLMEQQDEWAAVRRYFSAESMRLVLDETRPEVMTVA